jgi:hypothetical protein
VTRSSCMLCRATCKHGKHSKRMQNNQSNSDQKREREREGGREEDGSTCPLAFFCARSTCRGGYGCVFVCVCTNQADHRTAPRECKSSHRIQSRKTNRQQEQVVLKQSMS